MYNAIKTEKDIEFFLEKTNSLHDGYIVGVQYVNNGISIGHNCYEFNNEKRKLIIRILVTSICDAVIEIEFENLLKWQIKDEQWEITDTAVIFNEQVWLVWVSDAFINMDEIKNSSYVIAKSMKWKILE